MLDYQRIADDVRGMLFTGGQEEPDFLRATAADYSLAVDQVNERLRQCATLLHKGLRSEALQLCEIEPNLLDLVAVLDFSDRLQWAEMLEAKGLAPAAPLLLEAATELNEAYAVQQPLVTLLSRHRLLAMSRAPLPLRIDTLRHLAEADSENPVWESDLRTFEEERAKGLQQEVARAIATPDPDALAALARELGSDQWRERPPETLLRQVSAAQASLARDAGLAEMRQVEEELLQAHTALDLDLGRQLRHRWNELFTAWGSAADPQQDRVASAMDWLLEADEQAGRAARHAAAAQALAQAMAAGEPLGELARLRLAAIRDEPLSSSLERHYREHVAARERAARRRLGWGFAAVAATLFALFALGAILTLRGHRRERIETATRTLGQLLRDGDLGRPRAYVDQLAADDPLALADPEIKKMVGQLAQAEKKKDERRQSFLAAVEGLRKLIEEFRKSSDTKFPNPEALADAEQLAQGDDEKRTLRERKIEIDAIEREKQGHYDREFLGHLAQIEDRVATVERQLEAETAPARLAGLAVELRKLQGEYPEVTRAPRKETEGVQTQIQVLQEEAGTMREQLALEGPMTDACGDATKFRERLADYVSRYPKARRSISFQRVLRQESPLWDWLSQWNEMVRTVGHPGAAARDRKAVAEDIRKWEQLLNERAGHPSTDDFRHRLSYLAAVAKRLDDQGEKIEGPLTKLFKAPLMTDAWMMEDTSGRRYYLLNDPAVKFGPLDQLKPDGLYSFEYVSDFDASQKRKSLRGSEIAAGSGLAPQRAVAEAVTRILATLDDDNWEPSFCEIIRIIVRDTRMDPILRVILLQKTLEIGCKGSRCLDGGFGGHRKALENLEITAKVNWFDPNNSEGATRRPVATEALAHLPDFDEAQRVADKACRSLEAAIGTDYQAVGWLRRGPESHWHCLVPAGLQRSGQLFVVRPAEAGPPRSVVIEAVALLENGTAVIRAASDAALREGRPVYLAVPAPRPPP
jgi:hypothetical protein